MRDSPPKHFVAYIRNKILNPNAILSDSRTLLIILIEELMNRYISKGFLRAVLTYGRWCENICNWLEYFSCSPWRGRPQPKLTKRAYCHHHHHTDITSICETTVLRAVVSEHSRTFSFTLTFSRGDGSSMSLSTVSRRFSWYRQRRHSNYNHFTCSHWDP